MSASSSAAKRPKLETEEEETTPNLGEESLCSENGDGEEDSLRYPSEREVGITEFISDTPGFFAILKRRYV